MSWAIFIKFVSVSFQKQITYRFDYFMGVLNGFLYVFIFTSLWTALYSQSTASSHSGFSLNGIITYAIVAMAVRMAFSMDDTVIYKKVQDGSIAIDLVRPVSFFFMNLSESVGYSVFHIFARAIPILAISALIFDVEIPFDPRNLLLFAISALLGYFILFMINYLVGLLAFWVIEVFPFMLIKYAAITFLSGGIVPIDFFPEIIKPLIAMMPFQYILYTPTVIIMGHSPLGESMAMIAVQLLWVGLLAAFCRLSWGAGQRKLLIQGG